VIASAGRVIEGRNGNQTGRVGRLRGAAVLATRAADDGLNDAEVISLAEDRRPVAEDVAPDWLGILTGAV